MGIIGVDYSFSRPSPAALKAAGVGLVIRYTTGTKALDRAEAQALRALDIAIALVHETSIDRVNTGGVQGGASDMVQAALFAGSVGYPGDGTIFFACDTAPDLGGARAYFQGVRSRHGSFRVGWYGGWHVGTQLHAEGLVDVVWVANAASWSGFRTWHDMAPVVRLDPSVSVLQSLDHPLPGIPAGAYDYDEVLQPFPAWGMGVTPVPAPVPAPPPVQHPSVDIGDSVHTTDITGIQLDGGGHGYVDVRGVPTSKVLGVTVFGGNDPSDGHYGRVPSARVVSGSDPARVVLVGGEPSGTYTVRVVTV